LAGPYFFNRTDRGFFQYSLGEKNKKQKFVTRNPGDKMGVSGYGSFFCLWAVRAHSARGRVFTELWATPPTAGAMKIERGVVYNPTIYHGYLLEKNIILGATSHGLYCHLQALRDRSARGRKLTGPWATPPTAGTMKI
jgi:hypothetical protein